MIYQRPQQGAFSGRSDEELEHILAPACCECSDQLPVASEPAEWSLLELRDISQMEIEPREALIAFRRLDPGKPNFLCGDCFYQLTED